MVFRVKPADEIRAARERLDLTQVELAERLGVSPRSVQGWEAGRMPQAKHRRALADFLSEAEEKAA